MPSLRSSHLVAATFSFVILLAPLVSAAEEMQESTGKTPSPGYEEMIVNIANALRAATDEKDWLTRPNSLKRRQWRLRRLKHSPKAKVILTQQKILERLPSY